LVGLTEATATGGKKEEEGSSEFFDVPKRYRSNGPVIVFGGSHGALSLKRRGGEDARVAPSLVLIHRPVKTGND